jgi:predicted DNA-binding protein (UPF0251 family)
MEQVQQVRAPVLEEAPEMEEDKALVPVLEKVREKAVRKVIQKIKTISLYAYFKPPPQGIPTTKLKLETLSLEEIEALNLKDVENMDQETAV